MRRGGDGGGGVGRALVVGVRRGGGGGEAERRWWWGGSGWARGKRGHRVETGTGSSIGSHSPSLGPSCTQHRYAVLSNIYVQAVSMI